MPSSKILRLQETDNVAVALARIPSGEALPVGGISAATSIPSGHKVALAAIAEGDEITKYGQIIGFASADIAAGEHVHVHNVEMRDFDRDPAVGSKTSSMDMVDKVPEFMGYRRPSGRIGTRNYVGVVSTVNCLATAVQHIARGLDARVSAEFPNIDGVVPITHSQGCGSAIDGDGDKNLQRVLGGFCRHPNFCFVIVVGLGCEAMQVARLVSAEGLEPGAYLRTLTIQGSGGLRSTIALAIAQADGVLQEANSAERVPIPASELTLALQCGGSDGYSGITANPALGRAVDTLVGLGGTAILAETPEIYGAEHLLTQRAESPEIAEKLLARIRWWEDYTKRNGGEMNNNPSPGNKAGGLTTILEKSLGAVAKGGSTNLRGVYEYAEPIDTKGFVFMDSPGYDPASITGEVASGANIICFTTGRGSVYGNKPVPSIKLATNSAMYERMIEDMDINCGDLLDGTATLDGKGEEILDMILRVASGEPTKSEEFGLGDYEFVPWQIGAVM